MVWVNNWNIDTSYDALLVTSILVYDARATFTTHIPKTAPSSLIFDLERSSFHQINQKDVNKPKRLFDTFNDALSQTLILVWRTPDSLRDTYP